jgi:hypothetical protein
MTTISKAALVLALSILIAPLAPAQAADTKGASITRRV